MNTSIHVKPKQRQSKPFLCRLGIHHFEKDIESIQTENTAAALLFLFIHPMIKCKCTRCGKIK